MRCVKFVVGVILAVAIAATAWAAPVSVSITPIVDRAVLTPAEGGATAFRHHQHRGTRHCDPALHHPHRGLREQPVRRDPVTASRCRTSAGWCCAWVPRRRTGSPSAPGESIEAVVDLSEAYDMRRGGTYTITFRHPIGVRTLDEDRSGDGHGGGARP